MPVSQNGYSANDRSKIRTYKIAGEEVALRKGATGFLLAHLARWVHRNVESISAGHPKDDWGYAEREIRGGTELSNHASGTALDFNATQHPLGVTGTWTPQQVRRINRRLRNRYDDTIRWGENYTGRVDGMHFEINAPYRDVRRIARDIRNGDDQRHPPTVNLANIREQFKAGGTRSLPGVRVIQRQLNRRRGEDLAVDGYAGPSTRAAWRRFERSIRKEGGNGIPGYWSLRVLAGLVPGRTWFRVKRR